MLKKISLILFGFVMSTTAFANIAVVTHKDTVNIPTTAIKRIFTGKKQTSNGQLIKAVLQEVRSETRQTFDFAILNIDPSRLDAVWARLNFSGKSNYQPLILKSDEEVIMHIRSNPNSIGYVSEKNVPKDLRTLKVYQVN